MSKSADKPIKSGEHQHLLEGLGTAFAGKANLDAPGPLLPRRDGPIRPWTSLLPYVSANTAHLWDTI